MIPREVVDTAHVPGGGEIRLVRRGDEFTIMLGATVLMGSRLSGSEEALARLGLGTLQGRAAPQVLIGGLGMGFTLRAALALLPAAARVVVAELVPAVVTWARGPMADVYAGSLDDPRVSIVEADVGVLMQGSRGRYDAILLDVDNGPDGLSRISNDALYTDAGLVLARSALRTGGVLAIWSQGPDDKFGRRMARALEMTEHRVPSGRSSRGGRHTIWIGVKTGIRPNGPAKGSRAAVSPPRSRPRASP